MHHTGNPTASHNLVCILRRCTSFLSYLIVGNLIAGTLFFCCPTKARGQDESKPLPNSIIYDSELFDTEIQKSVDATINAEFSRQNLVGLAVGIIRNHKLVYVSGYGYENREKEIRVTPGSMFRWASISKPITAIAALRLAEQGKLDLDADIRTYVPEFPDKGAKITARQLLCHQSGVVHYQTGKVIRTDRQYETDTPFKDVVLALDNFKESDLIQPPGKKYSYSTHAYILLSAVVERAGKQPFAEQVDQFISQPLKMSSLQPDYQWVDIPHRAIGYQKFGKRVIISTNTDVSWKLGGGGFISDIRDLGRFAECFANKKLLKEETYSQMWTRQKDAEQVESGSGLGVFVSSNRPLRISHNGSQEKSRARMVVYPEKGIGIVVMSNCEFANPGSFTNAIFPPFGKTGPINDRPL